jgi:hypothetical protein
MDPDNGMRKRICADDPARLFGTNVDKTTGILDPKR